MKKLLFLPILLTTLVSCSQTSPTKFDQKALNDTMTSLDGSQLTFQKILDKYKGKPIVIDVWASWCPDCVGGMPKVKALQKQFPDVTYLFLSYDKTDDSWKQGIEKYNVKGEHYHVGNNMKKGDFSEAIKLDWIPRYIVVDKKGNVALFKAIEADDETLVATLKKLK